MIKENIIKDIKLTKEEEEIVKTNWFQSNSINNTIQLNKWKKENLQKMKTGKILFLENLNGINGVLINSKVNYKIISRKKAYLDNYIYSIIRVKSEGLSKGIFENKEKETDFFSIAKEFSEGMNKNRINRANKFE